ncbi:Uncharacterized protein SCF082_LOCUS18277 [Durusdinium trenchii]|uniref:Uncharacterized protein n=1 Tax=Durusdinium trenchii TaxID=1381693 RepID=A0ABP0KN33_9DINO
MATTGQVVPHEEPMNLQTLRRAAEEGDLQAMARMDLRLQSALEEDETLRRVGNRNWQLIAFDVSELSPGQCSRQTEDPKAQAALRLYQDSVTLGKKNGNIDREAFQAVMRDDADEPWRNTAMVLRQLIGEGLDLEVTNTGGHTLLQLAQERGKEHCAQVLLREGAGRTQCLAFSGKLVSYRIVRIVSESCPNLTYSSGGQKL